MYKSSIYKKEEIQELITDYVMSQIPSCFIACLLLTGNSNSSGNPCNFLLCSGINLFTTPSTK